MATKKAGGSSRNGRDSKGRRLGVKNMASTCNTWKYYSQTKRNQKYILETNVGMGKDHSIFSLLKEK